MIILAALLGLSSAVTAPAEPPINVVQKNGTTRITGKSITSHIMGMVMTSKPGWRKFVVDKGVFSQWKFKGSKEKDTLVFGPQGTIINKRKGGLINFGKDSVKDKFVFKNVIDVERCSKKHGFKCHPLNHLQQVVIKNFGKEDIVILQGKKYGWNDIKGTSFQGVPESRLKVIKQ